MRAELLVAPAEEPITLAEAKAHLRVTSTGEDTLITSLITAAREQAESFTRRKFITQQWRLYYDELAGLTLNDVTPVDSVGAVKYLDTDGVLTTLAADQYKLVKGEPAAVLEAYGIDWPSTRDEKEAVYIDITCGYGAASAVPQTIKQAMLLLIGHLFENRQAVSVGAAASEMPMSVNYLLGPYRVVIF